MLNTEMNPWFSYIISILSDDLFFFLRKGSNIWTGLSKEFIGRWKDDLIKSEWFNKWHLIPIIFWDKKIISKMTLKYSHPLVWLEGLLPGPHRY